MMSGLDSGGSARFTASPWLRRLVEALIVAYFALLPFDQRLAGQMGAAMALLGLLVLAGSGSARASWFERRDYLPLLVLLGWPLYHVATALGWYGSIEPAKMVLRFIPALAVVPLVRATGPSPTALWVGCALGGLCAAAISVWQYFVLDYPRATGMTWATVFGDISVILALLPLCALDRPVWRGRWAVLLGAGVVGGVTAAVLSGARGSWFALLVLGVGLVFHYRHWLLESSRLLLVATLFGVAVGAVLTLPPVQQRVTDVATDLSAYGRDQVDTSLGYRFEMWRAAWRLGLEHPLTGVGPRGFQPAMEAMGRAGEVSPRLAQFTHAHNDLLNALATGGLPGALVLVAFYGLGAAYFWRLRGVPGRRPFVCGGLVLVAGYALFGLSDVIFSQPAANTGFVGWFALLWAWAGRPVPPGGRSGPGQLSVLAEDGTGNGPRAALRLRAAERAGS